ncbi:hypothetical protein [Psychromonas sp. SP041]|uniref:hypothetical protein n=1 Tax=Psychromonas sp. SP041 TaxID=1365007 RepID=UPI0003F4E90D|nr:hypothetical protein [Psychromonas sp. SP041]
MKKLMQKGMKKATLLMATVVLLATTGCAPFFHDGPGGGGGPRFAEQQSYLYEGKNEDVHQVINEMISQHKANQEKEIQLVTSLN